ncbi:MAG: hypothetical protein WA634_18030 [Silvibacterium sp.]
MESLKKVKTPISMLNLALLILNIVVFASLLYYRGRNEMGFESNSYQQQINELDKMYSPTAGKR